MRFRRLLVATTAIGLGLLPAGAWAQGPTAAGARAALEATDRSLEAAEASVTGSANPQVREELGVARSVQERARVTYGAGRYALALRLTLEDRRRAERAAAAAEGLPDPDRVRTELERSREMLDGARERIQSCDDARARAALATAAEMEDRAESAERSGRYLGALQLTRGARDRGLRALQLCRMEEDLQDAARRALRRTDLVLSRARDLLDSGPVGRRPSEQARSVLTRAEALQGDAVRQLRAEQYRTSLQLTLSARVLAHRAVRIVSRAL